MEMDKKGDFGDMLIEEVLADTANDFFGKRKKIEDQISILQTYARELKNKGRIIADHLALLSYLLLESRNAETLFRQVGISECSVLIKEKHPHFDILPEKIKLGFRPKTKFTRLVLTVYGQVQVLCEEYRNGRLAETGSERRQTDEGQYVNFNTIMHMAELINDNIRRINAEKSPSAVIQFAKSFNSGTVKKEKITGAMSSDYNQRLNVKMRIDLVDPEKLMLDQYPQIPGVESVKPVIKRYCASFYDHHHAGVKTVLDALYAFKPENNE